MKRIFKKNQLIIAALAIMIAAAGYLNYSGRIFGEGSNVLETSSDLASQELLDISEEDLASESGDIESQDSEDGTVDGTPGEKLKVKQMLFMQKWKLRLAVQRKYLENRLQVLQRS